MSQCKSLWQIINEKTPVFNTSSWEGWVLSYLANKCFHQSKHIAKKNPFKSTHIATTEKLASKVHKFTYNDNNENGLRSIQSMQDFHHFFDYHDEIVTATSFDNILNYVRSGEGSLEGVEIVIISGAIEAFGENLLRFFRDYELCTLVTIELEETHNWNGKCYSRHVIEGLTE